MINVIGIRIVDRIKEAGLTQGILSKHASAITTRLGFHEVTDDVCSREAYIILHLNSSVSDKQKLVTDLKAIGGIDLREMIFAKDEQPNEIQQENNNAAILGLLVKRDPELILAVQKALTQYGCNIRTRLGINVSYYGKQAGLIILELKGAADQRKLLEKRLMALNMVQTRTMVF